MADSKSIRSKFKLEFETKGAEKVKRSVDEVQKGLGKKQMAGGMSELAQLTARNMRQMAGLSKHLKDVTKSLAGVAKAGKAIGKLAEDLKKAKTNAKGTADEVQKMRRGAFSQGLGQGLGFGPFLQRGPGMGRQAAGMAVGGAIRGFGGAPVRGTAAIAQGLASIPGGGLVTAMMSNALTSFASAQSQQAGITALGGIDATPGRRAAARARRRVFRRGIDPEDREAIRRSLMGAQDHSTIGLEFSGRIGSSGVMDPGRIGPGGELEVGLSGRQRQIVDERVRQQLEERANLASSRARTAAMAPQMSGLNRLQGIGVGMGFTPQQSLQMANQMGLSTFDRTLGAASGSFSSLLGMQRLGFGGAAEAGAFARAERRGGIQGVAPGGAGRGIDETIGRAMAMGMDRSEIRQLMAQMVSGQERFFTTGVPFARSSILDLTEGLSGALGAGARASRAAQAIAAGTQRVGAEGPQNAAQTLLVRQVAKSRGFGMSAEGIARTLQDLEVNPATPGELQGLMGSVQMGKGALGSQIGKRFFGQATGFQGTAQEFGRLREMGFAVPRTRGATFETGERAARATDVIQRRAASQEQQRVGTGLRLAPAVQKFEANMIRGGEAFGKLAPTITTIANGAGAIAEALPRIAGGLQDILDRLAASPQISPPGGGGG